MEEAFFGLVTASCLLALVNWRAGLYAGVVLDVLRDPVRKLSEEQSVVFTLAGALVWGVALLAAIASSQSEWRQLFQRYRQFRVIAICVPLAIVPAAALSVLLYSRGYILAGLGIASYVAPLCAIAMGFVFIRSEEQVYRLLKFYCLLNAIVLVSVPLEALEYDVPGLGGIKVNWIRYRGDQDDVKLISGWYRSPDIMGLHAAHVMMFSAMLAIRARAAGRVGWGLIAAWAATCLMLCGRRKMIGIPLVFMVVSLWLGYARGVHQVRRLVVLGLTLVLVSGLVGVVAWDASMGEDYQEYAQYASTIFTESHSRVNDLVIGSTIGTLQQSGVLGAGLGTATQGRYYAQVSTSRASRGWQEDGVSKLLLEFGVPGLILMLAAGVALVLGLFQAVALVAPQSSVQVLQIGLVGVVFGDAASFVISHQQFSGDPVSGMLVMILLGMVLGAPRVFAAQQAEWRRRVEARSVAVRQTEPQALVPVGLTQTAASP